MTEPAAWVAATGVLVAVLLVWPSPPRVVGGPLAPGPASRSLEDPAGPGSGLAPAGRRRGGGLRRSAVAVGAGLGAWVVVGGAAGAVAAPVVAAVAYAVLLRAEPAAVRQEREQAARELPHLVALLGATLRSGATPLDGLAAAAAALPGPAARRVEPVVSAARFGGSIAWLDESTDPVLVPLVRTLARAERSGSSVVDAVEQLADELEREAGAAAEDAARRVGVAAAVPLGVCLLPAFLLIGIVPTVAGLLSEVTR